MMPLHAFNTSGFNLKWFQPQLQMYGIFLQAARACQSKMKCNYSFKIVYAMDLYTTLENLNFIAVLHIPTPPIFNPLPT